MINGIWLASGRLDGYYCVHSKSANWWYRRNGLKKVENVGSYGTIRKYQEAKAKNCTLQIPYTLLENDGYEHMWRAT